MTIHKDAFKGCKNLTIYCQAKEKPEGYDNDWNFDNCNVVWGISR